jgi:hypothetical protein
VSTQFRQGSMELQHAWDTGGKLTTASVAEKSQGMAFFRSANTNSKTQIN